VYEDGTYTSSAFFIRHDTSSTEFLFLGDMEPDSLTSSPLNIDIWRAAAPKISKSLKAVFIECSWPSGRTDDTLYGHLTPEHLVAELVILGKEVVKHRKSEPAPKPRPARKRQKANPVDDNELVNALKGLRIYVMHCKDDMSSDDNEAMRLLITGQVRQLVKARQLGATIICTEPGMRISMFVDVGIVCLLTGLIGI
jgi:cAMP phosphodiesterase